MHYYLYKITNNINKKIYIGVHSTSNLNDEYMGSGKLLKRAIKKYGENNFKKEIIESFDNIEDMYAVEKQLVTEEFVNRKDTYNLKIGGNGGWDYINNNEEFKLLYATKLKNWHSNPENKEKLSKSLKLAFSKIGGAWLGKSHTDKTKELMKSTFASINHQQGEKNSMHGKMWIHSLTGKRSTRINKDEPIPEGWSKGRKLKF